MKKVIRNIVFDLGGVLINLDRQRCIDTFKQLGLTQIDELIGTYVQQGIFSKFDEGLMTTEEFRALIRAQSGKPLTDKQIDGAWNSMLADIPSYKLDALLHLRGHYMVYLLSNTNAIHWQWICENAFPYKTFDVDDYFEEIFLSYKMKLSKPGTRIFREVLDRCGLQAGETLFLDDMKENCEGAAALGISTYLCQHGEDWRPLFFEN